MVDLGRKAETPQVPEAKPMIDASTATDSIGEGSLEALRSVALAGAARWEWMAGVWAVVDSAEEEGFSIILRCASVWELQPTR